VASGYNARAPFSAGLDPASPLFNKYFASNEVLDKSDALFVDVIHTNIAFKGKISPLGHVDFYANNGVFQPGCGTSDDRYRLLYSYYSHHSCLGPFENRVLVQSTFSVTQPNVSENRSLRAFS